MEYEKTHTIDITCLTEEQTRRYNEIFDEISDDYTSYVDDLSKDKKGDIYWWTTSFASRSPFLSFSQRYISLILLVIEIIERNRNIDRVIVSANCISEVLNKYFQEHDICCDVISREARVSPVRKKMSDTLYFFGRMILFMQQCTRRKKYLRKYSKKADGDLSRFNNATLIETYIYSADFETGQYLSRDFCNIKKYADTKIVYYAHPITNNSWDSERFIKACCESDDNFVFSETYLHAIDYLIVLLRIFSRYRYYLVRKSFFKGIDVSGIINADIYTSAASENTFKGMIDATALPRMQRKGLDPQAFVGWYEGQPSSLGFFMTARRCYPEKRTLGYIGLPVDLKWIHFSPSREQYQQGVAPQEISAIGSYYKKLISRFEPKCQTLLAPAFRLQSDKNKHEAVPDTKTILVLLGYDVRKSGELLNCINNSKIPEEYTIAIRNHPDHKEFDLHSYGIDSFGYRYLFCNHLSFDESMSLSDTIVMIGESTSGLQPVLGGKTLICYCPSGMLIQTGLPDIWKNTYYYEAFSPDDIFARIQSLRMTDASAKLNSVDYIMTATKENVEMMLKA